MNNNHVLNEEAAKIIENSDLNLFKIFNEKIYSLSGIINH